MSRVRTHRNRGATREVVVIADDEIGVDDDQYGLHAAGSSRQRGKKRAAHAVVNLVSSDDDYEPESRAKPVKRAKMQQMPQDTPMGGVESPDSQQKKPKQPRKTKQPKAAPEKRTNEAGTTVRYAATPSQAVYARIQRALPGSGHRMFLISTQQLAPAGAPGGRAQEFVVLGATGNVYKVRISRHPHCDCPDHLKGNLCKHILFVMLRVLKLSTSNPLVWQKGLLTQEVEEILSGAHSQGVDAGVVAEDGVLRAYRAATGQAAADGDSAAGSSVNGRKPIEGDCPICFCELKEGAEPLVWCRASCGNNLHKECFDTWARAKRSNGQTVTCVYCRAPWPDAAGGAAASAGAAAGGSSYLNLAQHSHQYEPEDTTLEALYGETAMWINHHAGGSRSRSGAARMWRSGFGRR